MQDSEKTFDEKYDVIFRTKEYDGEWICTTKGMFVDETNYYFEDLIENFTKLFKK